MITGLIYKLTIKNSEYFLFGSTIQNAIVRKGQYLSSLRHNKYSNKILQRLYNKYGEESLKFEIVQENIPEDILLAVEDIWIGANCGRSDDKKKGMNIRDAQSPRHSLDIKKKISNSLKGNVNKSLLKPVYQFSKNREFIKKYSSIAEASRLSNSNQSGISKNLHGHIYSSGGFLWSFSNNLSIKSKLQDLKNQRNLTIVEYYNNTNQIKIKEKIKETSEKFNINYYTVRSIVKKINYKI